MTVTAAPTVKDQELFSFGLVESAGVNSFADLVPSKLNKSQLATEIKNDDFKDTFICHLIFYAFFCVSLALYLLIDLGLGSFIKKKFVQLIGVRKKTDFVKRPAFA